MGGTRALQGVAMRLARSNVGVALSGDASYPERLARDTQAPPVLFYTGAAGMLREIASRPRVCIVGTRSATGYGRKVAFELGRSLSLEGVSVVSGMALGIDAAAHRGAIAAVEAVGVMKGAGAAGCAAPPFAGSDDLTNDAPWPVGTVGGAGPPLAERSRQKRLDQLHAGATAGAAPPLAVVATAPEVCYPMENADLAADLAAAGAIISELPPGGTLERWRFVDRNRIMAGLSDVVIVVESHEAGGALHTVRFAERRNVPVAAVPGTVYAAASRGCNMLIREGRARLVAGVDDVMSLLGELGVKSGRRELAERQVGRRQPKQERRPKQLSRPKGEARPERLSRPVPRPCEGVSEVPDGPAVSPGPVHPGGVVHPGGAANPPASADPAGAAHPEGAACPPVPANSSSVVQPEIGEVASRVMSVLTFEAQSLEEIVLLAGMPVGTVALCLEELASEGVAREAMGSWTLDCVGNAFRGSCLSGSRPFVM